MAQPFPDPCEELYKPGDLIGGEYRIYSKLGEGGFGVVFLACHKELPDIVAIKTFRDEFLADGAAQDAFKKEALLWVGLEEHPFILSARWAREFSRRLFVAMDYIAPDEKGRVTLHDHLLCAGEPFPPEQALQWGVQLCRGMEHAAGHGIKCHRDIKPSNILVMRDGTPMIGDFGLAAAAEMALSGRRPTANIAGPERLGCSLLVSEGHRVCGTPGYIAPEVYENKGGDVQSDIYSFGIVLWQMATGSPVSAFHPAEVTYQGDGQAYVQEYQRRVYERQRVGRIPRAAGPLQRPIERCLTYDRSQRYRDFADLRRDLEELHRRATGRSVPIPQLREKTAIAWNEKGASLANLGHHEDAIRCYDQSLQLDPRNTGAWNNKGLAFHNFGRDEDAICCYDRLLQLDSRYLQAWNNKGLSLDKLGRYEEAIRCYDRTLQIDRQCGYAWNNKGDALNKLGRCEEAIRCFDETLRIDPRDIGAWTNMGNALRNLGRPEEAIRCCDRALQLNPQTSGAWNEKGLAFDDLGQYEDAIHCYDQAVRIEPRYATSWNNKGVVLMNLGHHEDAIRCYDQAIEIDPRYVAPWRNRATSLRALARPAEEIACYEHLLEIDPQDIYVWTAKMLAEVALGRRHDAANSMRKCVELGSPQSEEETLHFHRLLRELER